MSSIEECPMCRRWEDENDLRIVELENTTRHPIERPVAKPATTKPPTVALAPASEAAWPKHSEMLIEHQVAEWVNMSVATVRRWRLFRKGPKFLKIGSAVRYRRADVEAWLKSIE